MSEHLSLATCIALKAAGHPQDQYPQFVWLTRLNERWEDEVRIEWLDCAPNNDDAVVIAACSPIITAGAPMTPVRVPWDYSPDEVPINAVLTAATAEGKALGAELARLYVVELGDRIDLRCTDCALRPGTVPNGAPETLLDLVKCIFEGDRNFTCHVRPDLLCAGYAILANAPTPDDGSVS